MAVAKCPACGQVFVDDMWFFQECPTCGASLLDAKGQLEGETINDQE
jgi:Zn finger protein HypA/HybF involved in hydrogenase expression